MQWVGSRRAGYMPLYPWWYHKSPGNHWEPLGTRDPVGPGRRFCAMKVHLEFTGPTESVQTWQNRKLWLAERDSGDAVGSPTACILTRLLAVHVIDSTSFIRCGLEVTWGTWEPLYRPSWELSRSSKTYMYIYIYV